MAVDLKSALQDIKEISISESALKTMLDFEGVLDNFDIYIYKNWLDGELIQGPIYEKYYVTASFMWDYEKMPDPKGGEVLLQYKCRVSYKKDFMKTAVHVKSEDDYRSGTKMPKTIDVPVWIVTISIPKELMDNIDQSALDMEFNKQAVEKLEKSYDYSETVSEVNNTDVSNNQGGM